MLPTPAHDAMNAWKKRETPRIANLKREIAAQRDRAEKAEARIRELEAELAATERTLNAWIVRAKASEHPHARSRRD